MSILTEINLYCSNVLSGVVPACKWTKAAAKRHLDDLQRAKTEDFEYTFDEAKAARAVMFTELCPHVKGEWAVKKLTLQLGVWQKFIIGSVFGWVSKDTGYRRFKTVYVEVPRKNGKTTILAPPALYCLGADEEEGGELYSAATVRDQAKIVWNIAKRMVEKSAGLRGRFGIETSAHSIYQSSTDSSFKALSSEGHTFDGFNVSFAAVDELHAHPTREIYDVLETGMGSRMQPILWSITTAGSNRAGICYEVRTYLTKILNKTLMDNDGLGYPVKGDTHVDETFFGIIYTIDDDDDPMSEIAWKKANPNYGVSVNPEQLKRMASKALKMPAAMSNFLTKHLNVWVNADMAWMNMVAWNKCADPNLVEDEFKRDPFFGGADAASVSDLATYARVYTRNLPWLNPETEQLERKTHYYAFVDCFLPSETIEAEGNEHYAGWELEGYIEKMNGRTIDQDEFEKHIRASTKRGRFQELAYDPWQLKAMAGRFEKEKVNIFEFRQNAGNYTSVMNAMETLVLEGRLHTNDNPVLNWAISNVVSHRTGRNKEYQVPTKEKESDKIDPAVALLMALSRAILASEKRTSVYESRGVRTL